jgi:adhesin HecA-like repeat protein
MRLGTAALLWVCACASEPASPDTSETYDALSRITVERGVDRASVLSTHEARILKRDHGVKWSGVYIGGACNGGSGWTRARVEDIAHATGWTFMPIWVGQQSSRICGAHTLTFARGHADGVAAASRMHQMGWGANKDIPVALDVEAATYFDHPTASTRYVRGWVAAVRAAGYRAYVYGSPYGLVHYHDAGVRIDAVWAADYVYSGFRAVTPGSTPLLGSRYKNHNRAWQYAGDFSVSGAGRVDASTSNLLLAPAPGGTNRTTTAQRELPAACGVLEGGEGLALGESIASCDGAVTLTLASDGELELRSAGKIVWTAGTIGAAATVVMQDNGELVAFDDTGEEVFTSDSGGYPDSHLELGSALAAMAIVDDDGDEQWTSRDGLIGHDDMNEDLPSLDNQY